MAAEPNQTLHRSSKQHKYIHAIRISTQLSVSALFSALQHPNESSSSGKGSPWKYGRQGFLTQSYCLLLPQQLYQSPVKVWCVSSLYHPSSGCLLVCLPEGQGGALLSCCLVEDLQAVYVTETVRELQSLLGSLYLLLWHHHHQHHLSTWFSTDTSPRRRQGRGWPTLGSAEMWTLRWGSAWQRGRTRLSQKASADGWSV
jgi:hypothetical protein